MPVNTIVAFAVGLLILWILCKILSFPVKVIGKLIVNALVGAVVLFLFNLIGGFFGTFCAYTAAKARHFRALTRQSRHSIFELCQLYLRFTLAAYRVERENIQYEHTAVYNAHIAAKVVFKVLYLRGGKLIVENNDVDLARFAEARKLLHLTLAYIRAHVGVFLLLCEARKNLRPRRVGKARKLIK